MLAGSSANASGSTPSLNAGDTPMIGRKLLIVTGIIASVVVTACSDTTAPKHFASGGLAAAATLAPPHAGPATLVATINGGGTAEMQGPILFGNTVFGAGVKLYSDGTASGEIHCIDQHGGTAAGNVWGPVTSWSIDGNGVVSLTIASGTLVNFPGGHPQDVGTFIVRIQTFGGKGVGHWTLDVPNGSGGWLTVCVEILTSGQIAIRYE